MTRTTHEARIAALEKKVATLESAMDRVTDMVGEIIDLQKNHICTCRQDARPPGGPGDDGTPYHR